jgi:hypothetical protein
VPEALPRLVTELVGQAEAAGHDEAHDLVGQRLDRHLRGAGVDRVGRRGEGELRLVGDARVVGGDPEALAAVSVEVDVAVVVAVGVPRLAAHAHAGLWGGSDLHDRGHRLGGLELELTAHGQRQRGHPRRRIAGPPACDAPPRSEGERARPWRRFRPTGLLAFTTTSST